MTGIIIIFQGMIKDCDFTFAYLHGFDDPQDMVNKSIYQFVPSFLLPKVGQPIQKVRLLSKVAICLYIAVTIDGIIYPLVTRLRRMTCKIKWGINYSKRVLLFILFSPDK